MKTYFRWTEDISVNHDVIDRQHKKLIEKLNELLNAIFQGDATNLVEEHIDFLERYAHEHFDFEEKYMKEINFPGLERHHERHEEFVEKYQEFRKKLFKGKSTPEQMVFEIENFLGAWFADHLTTEDQKYVQHAKKMGVKKNLDVF
ncbi:MAG: hemerythrin family protein [Patescibacteria group bacterium]